jgi:hypothetical protein
VSENALCSLLGKIETFIVRTYIIEQKSADTGRTRAYPLARRLHYNAKDEVPESISPLDIDGVIRKLEGYIHDYCSDTRLESTLGNADVYNYCKGSNRLKELRLLLYTFEHHLEQDEEDIQFYADEVVNNSGGRFSVEHVWPQTPADSLEKETKELIRKHTHRLGNLALMTPEDNAVQGNDPFQKKKREFTGSKIRILEEIFENDRWNVDTIEAREERMLRVIQGRWPDERPDSVFDY